MRSQKSPPLYIYIYTYINWIIRHPLDLPVISPLSHEVLRTLNRWQEFALNDLISRGPPSRNYIPGCYAESGINGLAIHKYRSLLNKDNTPFISGSAAGPIRRLWNYLVRQEPTQEVFIKSIFGKSSDASARGGGGGGSSSHHNNHHHHQHDNETDEGRYSFFLLICCCN